MTIRVGIAGCGSHALGRIVPLLEASSELEFVAAWTRKPETQALLRERGVEHVHGDFERFLASDMDVVYIASPTGCHFEHASAVLRSGRHAWVEKPMASRLDHARELVTLAQQHDRMLAEAFMFTWHPQAEAIRHALSQERLGTLRKVTLTFCFPHLSPDNIRYNPDLGGGAWLDHGCYLVKALDCWFPGEWEYLGGSMDSGSYRVDISGAALLRRTNDGLIANLSWGFGHSYANEMQVIGAHGRMLVDSAFTKPASRSSNITLEDSLGQRSGSTVAQENAFAAMLRGFTQSLERHADWAVMRQDILRHAERFFALQALLKAGHSQPLP